MINIKLSIIFFLLVSVNSFSSEFCIDCFSVRISRPEVIRYSKGNDLDTGFSFIKTPNKKLPYRGFVGNLRVYRVDSKNKNMFGKRFQVIDKGNKGSDHRCGIWITGYIRLPSGPGHLLGLLHQENECNYPEKQTNKSFAIATSNDFGKTWKRLGTIIKSPFPGSKKQKTGEGDCRGVYDETSKYVYLYCTRQRPNSPTGKWKTIVARSHIDNVKNLKSWRKWHNNQWSSPGIKGDSTPIEADRSFFLGSTAFRLNYNYQNQLTGLMRTSSNFLNLGYAGLQLSLSTGFLDFKLLKEPLLILGDHHSKYLNNQKSNRGPWSEDLSIAFSVNHSSIGGTSVNRSFDLNNTYIFPGDRLTKRSLVRRKVSLNLLDYEPSFQVGVELARYRHSKGYLRSTTLPVRNDYLGRYFYNKNLGYLLTKKPKSHIPSIKIHECRQRLRNGLYSYIIMHDKETGALQRQCPGALKRMGTMGWIFAIHYPGTKPLYRCVRPNQSQFLSNSSNCERAGRKVTFLGYILK